LTDICLTLRPAREADCDLLFDWVNTPEARAAALAGSEPIAYETHVAWYQERMADAGCRIWIIESGADRLGMVRLQQHDQGVVISIFVTHAARRKGVAAWAIEGALADTGAGRAVARVRTDNKASQHLFESLGFTVGEQAADHIVYVRALRGEA
jgi:RimJ/RimL family protein N-acetyltransferase